MSIGTKVQDKAAGSMVGTIERLKDGCAQVRWPNDKTTWVPVQYLTMA